MDTHAQQSASQRGSVDAYYGRRPEPHYYSGYAYQSDRVERDQMTKGQIEAYLTAYNGQDDEKDWG
tara:strand:+ start:961 stop:1158 length:198 start_codon:yes stop_codon:yes gene_type:complete